MVVVVTWNPAVTGPLRSLGPLSDQRACQWGDYGLVKDRWLGPNEDRSHDVLTGALSLTQYEAPPLVPRGSSLDTTGLNVHLCSCWSTGLLVVTRAFNIHRHISKGPFFLFGLRFRSNYYSRKHVSLRPFTSSIVRGPYAWGPWGSPGDPRIPRILRGYASVHDTCNPDSTVNSN